MQSSVRGCSRIKIWNSGQYIPYSIDFNAPPQKIVLPHDTKRGLLIHLFNSLSYSELRAKKHRKSMINALCTPYSKKEKHPSTPKSHLRRLSIQLTQGSKIVTCRNGPHISSHVKVGAATTTNYKEKPLANHLKTNYLSLPVQYLTMQVNHFPKHP